jgi:ankyrin repeat protein
MLAVKFADSEMVRSLLDAGAPIGARDDSGRTALFLAGVFSEIFRILLEAGADIKTRDEEGNTVLLRKIWETPSLAEVEELLRLGIDPGIANHDGDTALSMAENLGLTEIAERLRLSVNIR